ncbi:MlaD family protein [Gelidibacter maritimus]|uniref:MCE family protein n=1 Tax=Gelidibacter maritimus TaxID=2761487 RepID=A0A7W2M287_9FLAO|nr:MlaD family protein [Gelidibacter maritimus]MBA6151387.1 MCE family protein [Gelidibacter maritimus]
MAKSNSQKVRVGIFVVVGTIILVGALYFIGSRQHIFTKNIYLYSVFDNVNGLILGNNVRYSGINVGTVTKIEMTEVGKITIEMTVEEKAAYFIKKDAVASISSDGLVGSMVVNISPGDQQHGANVVTGDYIKAASKVGMDDMLVTLSATSENLSRITNQILLGDGALGVLINDTIMAQNIQQTLIELRKTSEGTGLAMAKINQVISKINYDESAAAVILSDTAAANQIRKVFANLEASSEDVNTITKNLDTYIQDIKSGKGALNHLTQDETFVQEIDSTMIQIKEASEKLNENMEALQHNFFFRGYFKKKARQERKEAKRNEQK